MSTLRPHTLTWPPLGLVCSCLYMNCQCVFPLLWALSTSSISCKGYICPCPQLAKVWFSPQIGTSPNVSSRWISKSTSVFSSSNWLSLSVVPSSGSRTLPQVVECQASLSSVGGTLWWATYAFDFLALLICAVETWNLASLREPLQEQSRGDLPAPIPVCSGAISSSQNSYILCRLHITFLFTPSILPQTASCLRHYSPWRVLSPLGVVFPREMPDIAMENTSPKVSHNWEDNVPNVKQHCGEGKGKEERCSTCFVAHGSCMTTHHFRYVRGEREFTMDVTNTR